MSQVSEYEGVQCGMVVQLSRLWNKVLMKTWKTQPDSEAFSNSAALEVDEDIAGTNNEVARSIEEQRGKDKKISSKVCNNTKKDIVLKRKLIENLKKLETQ